MYCIVYCISVNISLDRKKKKKHLISEHLKFLFLCFKKKNRLQMNLLDSSLWTGPVIHVQHKIFNAAAFRIASQVRSVGVARHVKIVFRGRTDDDIHRAFVVFFQMNIVTRIMYIVQFTIAHRIYEKTVDTVYASDTRDLYKYH